jgi:hypothetical protein
MRTQEGGLANVNKGYMATMLRDSVASFFYFSTYAILKHAMTPEGTCLPLHSQHRAIRRCELARHLLLRARTPRGVFIKTGVVPMSVLVLIVDGVVVLQVTHSPPCGAPCLLVAWLASSTGSAAFPSTP